MPQPQPKFYTSVCLFLCLITSFWSTSLYGQDPIIQTDKGKVSGSTEDGLLIFKSIPFAKPPMGSLRWKAPVPAESWTDTLECKVFAASPMQNDPKPFYCWSEEFIAPPEPLSEDCLYLNVWTKDTQKKKPVVMWIYGGGLNSGSAACDIYDGANYAKEDIVFVSINYRVNIFGFFAHADLTKEGSGKGVCNFGLLDQVAALQWIKQNIAAFGGDPGNVTIIGQSAGSFSVHALVASPLAKGLFHKAIGHSGGLLGTGRGTPLSVAEANGKKLTDQVGMSVNQMRQMHGSDLLKLVGKYNPPYTPVLDGYMLPENLEDHFKAGKHNDVPMLAGWVTGDGSLGNAPKITTTEYTANSEKNYGEKSAAHLKLFPGRTDEEALSSMIKLRMIGFAVLPAILVAEANDSPVFIYEFDHVPTDKPGFPNYGAFHTAEVPFALQTLHTWDRPWKQIDFQMQDIMSAYWINFITSGDPNGKGLSKWKAYDLKKKNVLQLNTKPKGKAKLHADKIDFLRK